jgi:hypothetical protein
MVLLEQSREQVSVSIIDINKTSCKMLLNGGKHGSFQYTLVDFSCLDRSTGLCHFQHYLGDLDLQAGR